jgi:hypothetical protein
LIAHFEITQIKYYGGLWYYLKLLSLELNEREFVSLCGILAAPYRLKQYCLKYWLCRFDPFLNLMLY